MGYLYRPKLRSGEHGRIWWVKYYVNGRPVRVSTRTTKKTEAERFLAIHAGKSAEGAPLPPRLDRITYDELARDLREHYRTTGERNLAEAEFRLKHLDQFFSGHRAVNIGASLVTRYAIQRQGEGASNRTINIEISVLKKMLNLAHRRGKISRVPHFDRLKEAPPRAGFFEPEAFRLVLPRLAPVYQPPAVFSYVTGWRIPSEVLALNWKQVDFTNGGSVRLEPGTTKNEEGRTFPLDVIPALRAVLERQRAYTDQVQRESGQIIPWVFHRDGKPIHENSFRKAFKRAADEAGYPGRIPHDFRRSAVRNLVRAGVPESLAMKLTGHKTRSVFDRYDIVSERDLEQGAKRLSDFLGRARFGHVLPEPRLVSAEATGT